MCSYVMAKSGNLPYLQVLQSLRQEPILVFGLSKLLEKLHRALIPYLCVVRCFLVSTLSSFNESLTALTDCSLLAWALVGMCISLGTAMISARDDNWDDLDY